MGTKLISQHAISDSDATTVLNGAPDITGVLLLNVGTVPVEIVPAADSELGDGVPIQPGQRLGFEDVGDSIFAIADGGAGDLRMCVVKGGRIVADGLGFSDVTQP